MIEIKRADSYIHFEIIESLARRILHKFYDHAIPEAHTTYFITKYQTATAIELQVKNGHSYFLLKYKGLYVGYLGLNQESDCLLLDKLYLLGKYRGHKIGKKALEFTDSFAKKSNISKIELIVNKENLETIAFYKHMGYTQLDIVPNHFETGQTIENYKMEKTVIVQ